MKLTPVIQERNKDALEKTRGSTDPVKCNKLKALVARNNGIHIYTFETVITNSSNFYCCAKKFRKNEVKRAYQDRP